MKPRKRTPADANTIGGRLKIERTRLGLAQADMAAIARVAKNTAINWERGISFPTGDALAAFAKAGADVLYIITGQRLSEVPAAQAYVTVTLREAFSLISPFNRRRLLLDLLAGELEA